MKAFVYFTLDLIAVIRFVCLTVFLSYPVLIYLPQLTGIGFAPEPGRFHGDFHFENIIYSENNDFIFIDWRQDFAGDLSVGDIYYDLAKLMHGLLVSHNMIVQNHFSVEWSSDTAVFDIHRKQSLVECEEYFVSWLSANSFDVQKVYVLTALIFLNIAALHHHPYSNFLYCIGVSLLSNHSPQSLDHD